LELARNSGALKLKISGKTREECRGPVDKILSAGSEVDDTLVEFETLEVLKGDTGKNFSAALWTAVSRRTRGNDLAFRILIKLPMRTWTRFSSAGFVIRRYFFKVE